MDRDKQLEYCQMCKNKAFDDDKGIICNLTGNIRSFENECPDFQEDPDEINEFYDESNYDDSIIDFPPKPIETPEEKQKTIQRSMISIGVFILAFYLIFDWKIQNILILVGVILIHELGHFLAMKIFKYEDVSIFFVPLVGAFASGRKETISQKQKAIILLSGPVPGVIIGLILYYYGLKAESEFLIRASNIFIFINLFNLLPIMPLDGGNLIKTMFFESNEIINKIFIFLSVAVLTYFAIASQSYILLIIPFFLLMQLNNQTQIKKVKEGAINKGIDLNKTYNELSDREYWLLRDELVINMKYYSKFISVKNYTITKIETKVIKQIKAIIHKKPIKDLNIGGKLLFTLFWILTFVFPVVVIVMYYLKLGIEM
ncbi:MAG: site-2 protease family protein [Saprospiraceae bacterium]|nr:site-2 protease family protein [Saprospiraceae bacterium]